MFGNWVKTSILMAAIVALFGAIGALLGGAEICGDPQALASALDKIQLYSRGLPLVAAEAHPETAQMMIINPLSGAGLQSLFSTHPATEERIARLLAMGRGFA